MPGPIWVAIGCRLGARKRVGMECEEEIGLENMEEMSEMAGREGWMRRDGVRM